MNPDNIDVPDSTDWLGTPLAGLSSVEAALRCQVCKDLFTTPMITTCAHTFCSLCIRKCLSADAKCPACRGATQEVNLRYNAALEDVVEAFRRGRQPALEYARKPIAEAEEPPLVRASLEGAASTIPTAETVADPSIPASPSSRSPKRKAVVLDLEALSPPLSKRTRSSAQQSVTYFSDSDDEIGLWYRPEPPEGCCACPVCNTYIRTESINAHLDGHFNEKANSPPPRRPINTRVNTKPVNKPVDEPRPQPLPQLSYSLLKDRDLRKKLSELGIPSIGSKPMLERRHREWVTLWNANCDALRPRTKRELLQELDVWERTQGSRSSAAFAGGSGNGTNPIASKDFDGAAWGSRHGQEFQDLIAAARKGLKTSSNTDAANKSATLSESTPIPAPPTRAEAYAPPAVAVAPELPMVDSKETWLPPMTLESPIPSIINGIGTINGVGTEKVNQLDEDIL